jgi:beta-lactamase regulating signal transducer with metallopeptidase domain
MPLSYNVRLLFLCLATAGLVQLILEGLAWAISPHLLRRFDRRSASPLIQARILFFLQTLPAASALFLATFFCIPSYIRFEVNSAAENVGLPCLLAAAIVGVAYLSAFTRGASTWYKTYRLTKNFKRIGHLHHQQTADAPLLIIPSARPIMALIGATRPYILISSDLYACRGITPSELEVAIEHERAHHAHLDNLKLLCLTCVPHLLPQSNIHRHLRHRWKSCTEWAADDAASYGSHDRALTLAQSLVSFSRLGHSTLPATLSTAFICNQNDLAERISRLLPQSSTLYPQASTKPDRMIALIVAVEATLVLASLTVHSLYAAFERLLHL